MSAEILLRWRYWILSCLMMVSMLLLLPLSKMGIDMDNSPERFAVPGEPAFLELERLQESFGRDDFFALLVKGEIVSTEFFDSLEAFDTRLREDDFQCNTASLLQAPILLEDGGVKKILSTHHIPLQQQKDQQHLHTIFHALS